MRDVEMPVYSGSPDLSDGRAEQQRPQLQAVHEKNNMELRGIGGRHAVHSGHASVLISA